MRRLALAMVVLPLAGCGALRDAFSAQPTIAGSAASESLTVARLGDLAGRAKRVPLRADVLSGLAAMYLDYAVFAVDLARGRDLDDSALVLAAEWPTVSQLRQLHLHEHLIAARGTVTPAPADSVYLAAARRGLQQSGTIHFDSLYFDSLMRARQLRVMPAAPALVRQAVSQFITAREDDRTLATYRGGALRVRDFVRRLLAINPEDLRGITAASDGQLRQFVRQVGEMELVSQAADSTGVGLTRADWRHIRAEHASAVTALETAIRVSPHRRKVSAASEPARRALVMAHLNSYFDRALPDGRLGPVPPFLAGALRQAEAWPLNPAGINRALERAQAMRADSSQGGAPATGLRPAPGRPPVPSDGPSSGAR